MPYLPVDLDGKKKWPLVARGLGVDVGQVAIGFCDMWEQCWQAKRDYVSTFQLECLFSAPGEKVGRVLEAFGFLEAIEDGYRIRGAKQWLKVLAGRVEGGKTRAKTGQRDEDGKLLPVQLPASSQPAPAGGATSSQPAESQPFHPTPNTQHPILKKEEERESKSAAPTPSPEDLRKLWNETIPSELPGWRDLTPARVQLAKQRLKQRPSLDEWREVIRRIGHSDFCRGWNDRGWRASPDWLLKADTPTKVLEGKYDNREGQTRKGPVDMSDAEFLQRTAHLKADENGELILEGEP